MTMKGVAAQGLLALIIGGLLIAVVYGALVGDITDNTIGVQGVGNVTGATSSLTGLVPIAVVMMVLIGVFAMAGFGIGRV